MKCAILTWLVIPLVLITAQFLSPDSVVAKQIPTHPAGVAYHLRVLGNVPQGMTFWVAYGPPCGNFRVVQLRREATGLYGRTLGLARKPGCVVAYLAGYGKVRTQGGFAPGDPVIFIRSVRPAAGQIHPDLLVQWRAPLG